MDVQETEIINETLVAKGEMKKAGLFFFLLLLLEIPLSFLVVFLQSIVPEDSRMLLSILFTQGYLLICGILFLLITRKKLKADMWVKKYKLSTFFLSLLVLLTAAPMASWLNVFSQLFAKNSVGMAIFEISNKVPMWLGILIIGFLPGFIEELLYRGIIFQAFRRRSVLTGILVSALSFGLMHMNFNQILYAIYLGIVFAFMVEATGSITSTMILHMLFNGVNTCYMYILPKLYDFLGKYSPMYADVNLEDMLNQEVTTNQVLLSLAGLTPVAFGGVVLTVLLIRQIAKLNNRDISLKYMRGEKSITKIVKPVTVCLVLGWIICLGSAILALFA
ncbi:MAG: lysostaphin resistance A-like protein [Lachnospiraceae bacterium]